MALLTPIKVDPLLIEQKRKECLDAMLATARREINPEIEFFTDPPREKKGVPYLIRKLVPFHFAPAMLRYWAVTLAAAPATMTSFFDATTREYYVIGIYGISNNFRRIRDLRVSEILIDGATIKGVKITGLYELNSFLEPIGVLEQPIILTPMQRFTIRFLHSPVPAAEAPEGIILEGFAAYPETMED